MIDSLRQRSLLPEWMDQPGLDPSLHRSALRGLERINRISRSPAILWPPLRDLAKRTSAPLRILDVATGAGDLPLALRRRAQREGVDLNIDACDASPVALRHAEEQSRAHGARIGFFRHDVLADPLPGSYDAVICSLFLHHLDRAQAIALLASMRAAARAMLIVNDLNRSPAGLLLAWTGTRLLSRSPVVHFDGPQSVRAAWTADETRDLAREAGMPSVTITRHWPCRWRMIWSTGTVARSNE